MGASAHWRREIRAGTVNAAVSRDGRFLCGENGRGAVIDAFSIDHDQRSQGAKNMNIHMRESVAEPAIAEHGTRDSDRLASHLRPTALESRALVRTQ